jgi:hypothetical protein
MTQNSMATTSASLESSMAMEVRPSSVPYSFLMIASGKEVAKFCQVYFLRELTQIEDFRHRKFESALRRCFHRMDEMVEDEVSFLSPLPLLILSPLHRPMIISYSSSVKFPTPQIGNPPLTTTTNSGSRREQRTRMDNFLLQNLLPRRFQSLKPWHCSKNCSPNSTRFPSRPCPALTPPPQAKKSDNVTLTPLSQVSQPTSTSGEEKEQPQAAGNGPAAEEAKDREFVPPSFNQTASLCRLSDHRYPPPCYNSCFTPCSTSSTSLQNLCRVHRLCRFEAWQ